MMKRFRRATFGSVFFSTAAVLLFVLLLVSGNILFAVAAGVCIFLSPMLRKRESFESYRDRYEDAYGLSDKDDKDEGKKE